MREGVDGARIYQPLKGTDFISLAASYVLEHDYFFDTSSPAQFDQAALGVGKNNLDYNTQWAQPTAINGHADTPPLGTGPLINKGSTPGFNQGNDSFGGGLEGNFWALHPNPVVFGQIRGASKFSLTDKLTFTFDPSFFLHPGQRRRGVRHCRERPSLEGQQPHLARRRPEPRWRYAGHGQPLRPEQHQHSSLPHLVLAPLRYG